MQSLSHNKLRIRPSGFTLIELLTVISIIGLLASVIFASLSTARDNARVAGGKQQDASIYHSIGDQLVGDWEFDECANTTATDSSGNGNTGAITAGAWSSDTPYGRGCSLSLNGSNTSVAVTSSMSVTAPFTVSAWIKPTAVSANSILGSRVNAGVGFDMKVQSSPSYIHADISTDSGWLNTGADGTYPAPVGKWTFIAYSVTATGYSVYANGALVGSGSLSGGVPMLFNSAHPLKIGQCGYSCEYFNGLIDGVRVYAGSVQ